MKRFFVGIVCMAYLPLLHSQQPINPQKDKTIVDGYTIQLLPGECGGYGYQILKNQELLVYQRMNPFTMTRRGLDTKEDAWKVAKWQLQQLKKESSSGQQTLRSSGNSPLKKNLSSGKNLSVSRNRYNQPLPPALAKEMNIDLPAVSKNAN